MNQAYLRLARDPPARGASAAAPFATTPRALRSWIDALPMANFTAAARRLLDALQALNAQAIDPQQRLDALEVLRGAALQLAASTDKQIIGASFPLPSHKAELGELALAYQRELAQGYRFALAGLCGPRGTLPMLRARPVALASVRTLQHAAEHLAKAYLLYRTPPPGTWQLLHDAYGFAASLRLDDRMVDDGATGHAGSARATYLHALLLALANPYRYTQREQGEIAGLVRALAVHAQLRDRNGGPRDVRIDVEADAGPGYLPEERADGARGALSLHLDALLAFIDDQQSLVPADATSVALRTHGGSAVQVDAQLLRHLVAGWRGRAERSHARLGGGYALETVIGLHDLHFMLADSENFDSFLQHVRGQAISLSEADRGASWRLGASESVRAVRLPARVIDQGLGGYRLLWARAVGEASVRARVGELVGLALPDTQAGARLDWMVGMIRWIRIDAQGDVDAGIELLSRRALPVGVRPPDGRAPIRGLLLASLDADASADHDALLVPTEIDRASAALELMVPSDLQGVPRPARNAQASGLRVREATGFYQQFAVAGTG